MILRWQLDPILIGGILTLCLLYGLLVGPLRRKLEPDKPFPVKQALWFYGAMVVMYLTEGSPLHDLAEIYLFSAHMGQHLALSYIVPPMMILGMPDWLLRRLLLGQGIKPVMQFLTRPVVAILLYIGVINLWHFPVVYEAQLRSSTVHHIEHVIFIAVSAIMWWPIMSPLKELPRLGYGTQIMYLFLLPVGQYITAAILALAPDAFYPSYIAAPRITGLTPHGDQQLGGVIMKISGFVAFGIPLIIAFFKWYAQDGAPDKARVKPVSKPG